MKQPSPPISLAALQSRLQPIRSHQDIDEGAAPTQRDLAESLTFSPGDGRIWLNDQRMVLWHASTYGSLRRELIASVGQEQARSLLTRVGYAAGARDAALVRRLWPDSDPANAFHAGPRMHRLEGMVRPETIRFEFDIERGDFFADYWWHDSSEDDEHIAAFGIGTEPACWMQLGYASGYASAFMGKSIIYRETLCRAMGAEACRITGRPAEQWEQPELDQHYFAPEASARRVRTHYQSPAAHPAAPSSPWPAEPSPASARPPLGPAGGASANEPIGISSSFSTARHLIERVAPTQATVLFSGASGVGKELFAQTLHRISPRSAQPFVAVNCAALPDSLVESELFGVERGAFTGATTSRPGRFERAHLGTLFLDEIASLSYVAQGKLLRALQEKTIERVGGTRSIAVDVRVVAASNVDLRAEVQAGHFREDLMFRLNVFPITLPLLKDRRDDIPLLMDHFRQRYSQLHGRDAPGFTPRAVRALLQYEFPGNIRELQNLVERGVIMVHPGEPIDVHHLFRSEELAALPSWGLGNGGSLSLHTEVRNADTDAGLSHNPQRATRPRAHRPAPAHPSPSEASPHPAPLPTGSTSPSSKGSAGTGWGPADVQRYRQAWVAARYNLSEAARQLGVSRAQLAYRLKKAGLS